MSQTPGNDAAAAALAARARAGDEAAFEALVARYTAPCARLAGHFIADRDEVADLVQESFVAAFEHLDRYDPRRPFWMWLARIVVNKAIDRLRSARRQRERPVESLASRAGPDPTPDRLAAQEEERERVGRTLDRLPQRYRTLLVLREMEGMSAESIAEMLRRPAATIRWRLFRARRLFREAWQAQQRGHR